MNDFIKTDYYNEDLFRSYVGNKYNDYYRGKWYGMNHETWFLSWNWAGILGPTWLIYRKMYLEAIVFTGFAFLIMILFWRWTVLIYLSRLVLPCLGNCLYFKKTYRMVKKEKDIDDVHLEIKLGNKGGTSIGAAILFELIILLVQFSL